MNDRRAKVYLGKLEPNSKFFKDQIYSGLENFKDFILNVKETKSKTVIIKPNILPTEFRNNGLGVTNPKICAVVADYLKENGFKKIILAEGTTNNRKGEPDTLKAMKNNGFSEYNEKWEPFDMNNDEVGRWFEIYSPGDDENKDNPFDIEIGISKKALKYPIISIAKFKAHDVLGLTLSVKNLMGCLCKAHRKSTGQVLHEGPRVKSYMHGFGPRNPYQIEPKELNFTTSKTALAININRMAKNVFPIFSLLDAAPAMEGKGPLRGTPNKMSLFLCSNDSVALDAVACKIAGIDLQYNQYIKNLARLNLGISDYSNVEIINPEWLEDFMHNKSFKLHEWFQHAEFSAQEIELLKKYS